MPLGWVLAEKWVHLGGFEQSPGLVCVDKNVASPKLYVLEPWIADLLVNYEQLDKRENFLAGQVVRVLSDSTAPGQPGLQEAVVQVSDGSCYIRVVITPEALQAEENAHLQLRLSSLNCRIIVLQKYTVCFQDEARLEDCEFYLTAQQFIVLPMQRQRMESSDGNQDPSVVKKIKELWLRNLAVRNAPSSEPSVSQLIDAIGQNQLEILKENAEECLDLWKSKDKPVTVEDEVPVTQWEAERKKEGENVFMVPVSALVIPPEEEAVVCDSSEAASAGYTDTSQAAPGKSSDDRTMPGDPSVVSQTSSCLHSRGAPAFGSSSWPPMNAPDPIQPLVSSTVDTAHLLGLSGGGATSPALSDSLEGSPDNPWDRMPSLSLTPSSSDEKTFQPDPPLKTQKDVAADSNTTDLLELCSQGSPEGLPQGEPVQTSSPSLLRSHSTPSPVEISTTEVASAAEAAWDTLHADRGPQGSRGSQATLPALPPVFPALPGSSIQSLPGRIPHREQACSSGTTSSSDVLRPGLAHSRTQGRETAGAKRKMVEADEQGPSGQQLTLGTSEGRGRGTDKRSELMSPQGAKKSRKQTGLQRGKELEEEEEEDKEEEEEEEEEQASPARAGPSSRPEQCRAPEPFMERPPQYQYEAPSPELCQQVQSIRISKAMLKWACWILTEEEDS
ncbi:cyclic nucleotide-gated cation channel beta-1-like isoform X2 [Cyanistes caeruleus]|uniref:cyclic nucleotide-gated cation channel beta-1-like isoform X2 n=1 Tax=Cyanistes caeruleus TaxID=156563 RepID=UPI000CDA0BD1|nr:cyclic nucleotide-gated cation channel beta-1-like isoform X2 [Cyanistes caeruleus]